MGVVTKSRITYFDILNILACFAVLSLHHNGIVLHYLDIGINIQLRISLKREFLEQ